MREMSVIRNIPRKKNININKIINKEIQYISLDIDMIIKEIKIKGHEAPQIQ